MKVQCVNNYNYPNNSSFKHKTPARPPVTTKAASTFGLWFGFGVGLDFLSRKVHFSKSPVKNSFAINGILAGIASSAVLFKEYFGNKQR